MSPIVAFCALSGLGSEIFGPGDEFDAYADGVMDLASAAEGSTFMAKPYSVLPGNVNEFISLLATHDVLVLIGHSFGGAAAKWLTDEFHRRGIINKVAITVLEDAVPNTDRFGEFF